MPTVQKAAFKIPTAIRVIFTVSGLKTSRWFEEIRFLELNRRT